MPYFRLGYKVSVGTTAAIPMGYWAVVKMFGEIRKIQLQFIMDLKDVYCNFGLFWIWPSLNSNYASTKPWVFVEKNFPLFKDFLGRGPFLGLYVLVMAWVRMSQQKYTFNDVSVFEKPGLDAGEQNGLQTFTCSTVPLHDKLLSLKKHCFFQPSVPWDSDLARGHSIKSLTEF